MSQGKASDGSKRVLNRWHMPAPAGSLHRPAAASAGMPPAQALHKASKTLHARRKRGGTPQVSPRQRQQAVAEQLIASTEHGLGLGCIRNKGPIPSTDTAPTNMGNRPSTVGAMLF